ncbi:hydroxymethylglutaryl-CoA synthase [Bacillus mojavensis]|uniref:hydroxymethylglutaryl-CoA synthase n=1 Tax=Bacillus mojavensis TaxID=72360 RepID=UPI002DB91265|nr:hydroxymethylglutaryl-CoA synthase [Bacillus mojavensis]MEC1685485.1 hydroxymethylglutaryl-CoA synthase [Bacillus mojavensis]MEC1708284.1 hydroxymethylglutaryl-CoA synthase [Bacillus mojavensis]
MHDCGIVSYGIKVPVHRIKAEDVVNVWKNNDINILKKSLNIHERAVLNSDEDVVTLAFESAINCIENTKLQRNEIEALYLGTSTNPDLSRSSAARILEMLGDNHFTMTSDIQFSGKSGTSALQLGYSLVKSSLTKNALIIGSDTINRHIPPGDQREPYAGAGAASVLLGNENVIADIEHMVSYTSDFPDDIRPEDQRYIRSGLPLGRDKTFHGLVKHSIQAANKLFEISNTNVKDYKFGVFQQTTGTSAFLVGDALGFDKKAIVPSIYADKIGDAGAASPLIGLSKVLDIASPGDKILVIGYGFGAGADAISLRVTDFIKDFRNKNKIEYSLNKDIIHVDYATATKYEFKYIRPDISFNTYL